MIGWCVKERSANADPSFFVASTGIEPVSGASETLILSIVLRGPEFWNFEDLEICNKIILINNFKSSKFQIFKSFNKTLCIRGKDLYRDGQQNYAKKFPYGH